MSQYMKPISKPGTPEPAFPRSYSHYGHNGISIRDYFAAKAMQAIIAKHPAVIEGIDEVEIQRITAAGAYSYADAMISERAKQ